LIGWHTDTGRVRIANTTRNFALPPASRAKASSAITKG
jgi:hypothetical protein